MKHSTKSSMKKIGALTLTAAITISMCGCSNSANKSNESKISDTKEKNYQQIMNSSKYGDTTAKDETVYVVKTADADNKSVVVSEWLRNGKGDDSVKDYSTLTDIENTSGTETFTKQGSDIVWATKGSDIQYNGKTAKPIPVDVNVTYYLNGEKMDAKDIAGKSGKAEIHFDYKVSMENTETVDESSYTVTHPYTLTSGLILSDEHFSNIEVSNGKAINDGNKSVCLGIAFPGLQDDLNLDTNQLTIPDSVVIKADTDNFEIGGTYTAALSGVLDDVDISDADDLDSKISELEDGLTQLSESSNKLVDGTNELSAGAAQLKVGTAQLVDGSVQLARGINTFSSGLKELSDNSDKLNEATAKLEDSIFKAATLQYQAKLVEAGISADDAAKIKLTPENYLEVINGVDSANISKAESKIRAILYMGGVKDSTIQSNIMTLAYNLLIDTDNGYNTVTDAVNQAAVKAMGAQTVSMAMSDKACIKAATTVVAKKLDPKSAEGQKQIAVIATAMKIAKNTTDPKVYGTKIAEAKQYATDAAAYSAVKSESSEAKKTAVRVLSTKAVEEQMGPDGSAAEAALKAQLNSIIEYVASVKAYTDGVDLAYAGSQQLIAGMSTLNDGIIQADTAAGQLSDGASVLSSSMNQFNKDGIQKMVNSLDVDKLNDVANRFKAVTKAAKEDVTVGGKISGMAGDSKIIFKTAEVKSK